MLRRQDDLEVGELPRKELFVYDKRSGLTRFLEAEIALVWSSCDGTKGVEELSRQLETELNVTPSEPVVRDALLKLRTYDLLL